MSKIYQKIQPEVIAGLGERTEYLEKQPPFNTVVKLHIQLEDWLGDDLMECHPCFIVTEELKKGLENSEFNGFEIAEMEVTQDEYFSNNYQLKKPLPKFYWLKIIGKKDADDFYLSEKDYLMSSGELTNFIKENYCHTYLDINKEEDTEQQGLLKKLLERAKQRKNQ